MKPQLNLTVLAVLLLSFSFLPLSADETKSTPQADTASPETSEYELDDADRIPPVPVLRLQEELGKDFSDEQIQQLKQAHKERVGEVIQLNKKFLKEVSEITGLTEDEILGRNNNPRRNAVAGRRGGPAAPGAGRSGPRANRRDAVAEARFVQRVELIMDHKGENMTSKMKRQVDRAWEKRSDEVADIRIAYAKQIADITNVSLTKIKRYLHLA